MRRTLFLTAIALVCGGCSTLPVTSSAPRHVRLSLEWELQRDGYQVFLAFANALFREQLDAVNAAELRSGLISSFPTCIWVWSADTPASHGRLPGFTWVRTHRCIDWSHFRQTDDTPVPEDSDRNVTPMVHGYASIEYTPVARVRSFWASRITPLIPQPPIRSDSDAALRFEALRPAIELATATPAKITSVRRMEPQEDHDDTWVAAFEPDVASGSDSPKEYHCSVFIFAADGNLSHFWCDPSLESP